MPNPLPEVPDELLPHIGHASAGWKYLNEARSYVLPTELARANGIRRAAQLLLIQKPRRKGHR